MAIIGIDLGTTNSLAAVWKNGVSTLVPNAFGDVLTPSVVSLDEDGSILVGRAAKERLVSHPSRSAAAFKRRMGRMDPEARVALGEVMFSPEDLSSFVLRRLREDAEAFLGEPVEEAVVSVPAYFNDAQRAATKRAGTLAGLKVERLVNEPSAAALTCRLAAGGEDQRILVFDFGGGTLDVSVVECFENVVSIVAVSGDNHLGGDDFDRAVAGAFCRENGLDSALLSPVQRALLLRQAEQWKMALGTRDQVLAVIEGEGLSGSLLLTNEKLIEWGAELFARLGLPIRRALSDSGCSPSDIDDVVLVGGSCKMPTVRAYLARLMRREPARLGSPDTAVALGVGTYAGMKARSQDIRDLVLTDICPFTLGTASYNRGDPSHSLMVPIIERNSVLPTSKSRRFYTVHDGQTALCADVYQGESLYVEENLRLGQVEIEVPPAPAGSESIDVRFTYDINGILEVEARNETTGRTERTVLVEKSVGLTEEAVEARLRELSALKIHPREQEENRLIVARCQRLYRETLGEARLAVGQALESFQAALGSQEPIRIRRLREQVEALLDQVEADLECFPTGEEL